MIPTFEEACRISEGYSILPIAKELLSDVKTPIEILRNIRMQSSRFFILESVENGESWGRYTFLGYEPSATVSGHSNLVRYCNSKGNVETISGNPNNILRSIFSEYKSPRIESLPPFTGGFVGYFSYDYIKHIESHLSLKAKNPYDFDDFFLMQFDKVIAFDHFKQKIYLINNINTDNLENNYNEAVNTLIEMEQLILSHTTDESSKSSLQSDFSPHFTKEQYCDLVEKAKHYITEGDIFQVVPSNRFTADFSGDLLQTYRLLRTTNPSPYMFYVSSGEMELAGASPETLVSLKDGIVSTFPLAGTCPRGKNQAEDQALIQELLSDHKELAEHDMLVDLGRNDLGKISEFGSVKVDSYRQIKRFSHVSHIASKVTGTIREDKAAIDAITAALPAGTLSGAPKKRACEIIDELEGTKRGPYGGAVGYIDFTGNIDMCIGIRMAILKDGKVHVQSGGGVVADSIPEKEYEETVNKAGAVMEALRLIGSVNEGGIDDGTLD